MQVLQIECSRCVDNNAQTMYLVKFIGEGEETIEVKLAASAGAAIDDAKLVARAKAIMVQVASFTDDVLTGERDYRSDASLSSLDSGSRFRFVYRDDNGITEIPEVNLPSIEAARADALRSATELLAEARLKRQEMEGWAVRVYDADGQLVVNVDFDDAKTNLDRDDSL